jgi:hypothetical protein
MADAKGPGVLLFGGWDRPTVEGSTWQPAWALDPAGGWADVGADRSFDGGDLFAVDGRSGRAVFIEVSGAAWSLGAPTSTWTQLGPGAPGLHGARLVYDSGSRRFVTFSGDDFSSTFDDTWSYDLDADVWTRMDPKLHPPARTFYAMAYDAASDLIVLFGGSAADTVLDDTWTYDVDRDVWTLVSRHGGPAPRDYAQMADDPTSDGVVLFGGANGFEEPFGDTWAFDTSAGRWTQVFAEAGPTPRAWHAMAVDAEHRRLVLFGGGTTREDCTNETWVFDPGNETWSEDG